MNPVRDKEFFTYHHEIAKYLDQIEWFVFGSINFPKEIAHQKSNDERGRRFFRLMNGLASYTKVKTKRLVYYQFNEVKPETDYHHIHFLLGRHSIEQFDAETVCRVLMEKATELGMPDSVIEPFDPTKDGVAYVTKKTFKMGPNGRYELMPNDYHPLRALSREFNKKGIK